MFLLNLLTFMEFANTTYFSLEDTFISASLLYNLANRCGFKVITSREEGKMFYKLKKIGIPCEILYTREQSNTFDFLDLADLHIGSDKCQIDKIKICLENAVKQGIRDVFIAGDLLNGVPYGVDKSTAEKILNEQIPLAYSIFRKYPLNIRAIPGNHEFTYDLAGIINPLKILEEKLEGEKCTFKAYDGYIQDFVIAGIVKRMIHIEKYYYEHGVYSSIVRLKEFKKHGGLIVRDSAGVKRPIRFLQCGHVHKNVEFYDSDANAFITQPGSFLRDENQEMPCIRVRGSVTEEQNIIRY